MKGGEKKGADASLRREKKGGKLNCVQEEKKRGKGEETPPTSGKEGKGRLNVSR